MSIGFHTDASLLVPLATNIVVPQRIDGSDGAQPTRLYLGDVDSGLVYEEYTDPGVNNIEVSITDDAPGSGNPVTDVKLASTQPGLATAVPGDPLVIGLSITSGTGGAEEVWIEVEDSVQTVRTSTELKIVVSSLRVRAA
jgi:hypothetical protein